MYKLLPLFLINSSMWEVVDQLADPRFDPDSHPLYLRFKRFIFRIESYKQSNIRRSVSRIYISIVFNLKRINTCITIVAFSRTN